MISEKSKWKVEAIKVSVKDNTYQDAITRGSLGGISVLGTIFRILWKLKGKIRHLKLMSSQVNFPLPIAHVHQQPQAPVYAPNVYNY